MKDGAWIAFLFMYNLNIGWQGCQVLNMTGLRGLSRLSMLDFRIDVWYSGSMENSNIFTSLVTQPQVQAMPTINPNLDLASTPLEQILHPITGTALRYLLFRIVGMNQQQSLANAKATQGQYNDWVCNDADFQLINSWVKQLGKLHRQEAIVLLRRGNQLTAVILEEEIINKVLMEVQTGEYDLLKTPIAKEVYNKLIAAMDATPVFHIREANFGERARQHLRTEPQTENTVEGVFSEITGAINDTNGTISVDNQPG